jgi:hypothetical protein
MSRKLVLTLATAAALAVSALATSAADAHGFGGGGGRGGFGGGHASFGGGHGGFRGGHASFGGGHGGFGGGRGFGGGHGGFGGGHEFGHHELGHNFGHGQHWAHWHWPHHEHWFWRDGRWVYSEGYDSGYTEPVAAVTTPVSAPGSCSCLTKSYTQDGMVVFADLCTKESAAASAENRTSYAAPEAPQESSAPPRAVEDKVSEATPTQTPSNFAGRTYKDFLLANGLPVPQGAERTEK